MPLASRTRRLTSLLFSLALFALALWAIRRSLGRESPRQILLSIVDLPTADIILALLCAAANYLLMAGVDTLAARAAGKSIPYRTMLAPSFIGATFQYNAGMFGGAAVRYRLFSSLGCSPREIGAMMLSSFLAFGAGFALLSGLALLWNPAGLPFAALLPWGPAVMGSTALGLVILYFGLCARRTEVRCARWNIRLPRLSVALPQALLAMGDWVAAAGIVYVLLPAQVDLPFPLFASVYVIAHLAGIVSNAPGGLGMFDATMLHLLPGTATPSAILASLLAFRGIYYVAPLLCAAVLLGRREWIRRRGKRRQPLPVSHGEMPARGPDGHDHPAACPSRTRRK